MTITEHLISGDVDIDSVIDIKMYTLDESITSSLLSLSKSILTKLKSKILEVSKVLSGAEQIYSIVVAAEKESGESFIKNSKSIKAAMAFNQSVKQVPIPNIKADFCVTEYSPTYGDKLSEGLDPTFIASVGLAMLGGMPYMFKGLSSLAKFTRLKKLETLFSKGYHVTEKFEKATIDTVIPDRLSYVAYKMLYTKGFKASKSLLALDDYRKSKDKDKVEYMIYSITLIYFLLHGIRGLLHAGVSLMGAVEGTCVGVKSGEIAKGFIQAMTLVRGS